MGARIAWVQPLVPDFMENITPPEQYELLELLRMSGYVDWQKELGRPTKCDGRALREFAKTVLTDDGFDFGFDFDKE